MDRSDYTRAWLPDKRLGWVPVLFIKELNEGNSCLIKRIVDDGTLDQEGEVEEVNLRIFGEIELGGWDICDGLPLMESNFYVFIYCDVSYCQGLEFSSFLVSLPLLLSASAAFRLCIQAITA